MRRGALNVCSDNTQRLSVAFCRSWSQTILIAGVPAKRFRNRQASVRTARYLLYIHADRTGACQAMGNMLQLVSVRRWRALRIVLARKLNCRSCRSHAFKCMTQLHMIFHSSSILTPFFSLGSKVKSLCRLESWDRTLRFAPVLQNLEATNMGIC